MAGRVREGAATLVNVGESGLIRKWERLRRGRHADGAPSAAGAGAPVSVTRQQIIDAVLAELDDFIDPPMVSGLTVLQADRLWIARRVAARVCCPEDAQGRDTY